MYSQIASNKRKSVIIMVSFAIFAGIIAYLGGYFIGGRSFAPYAIFAGLVYVVISYFSGSKMALALNGANQVSNKDEPRLYRIVENLAITDGLPMPKVYVIEDKGLNAFATGRDPNNSVVCATRGLLDVMDDSELQGVMAHELGHVKNYDIRVSLVAFCLASIVGIVSDIALRSMFFGNNSDNDESSGSPVLMIVGIVAVVLSPIVASMIQLAISRQREYLADATGALTTRYPEGLASALRKIGEEGGRLQRQNSSTAHLFFANPLKAKSLAKLFSTHPPIEDRIKKLQSMGSSS
ncbi:M48 family metalloprotease [Candidatus Saccharibacteria bacterium]|nr:M48 family metalloprotease [Candidatus Saccharibacteria bacterium]